MSEQSTNGPTITSDVKEKNSKRVAAGKRLGVISKQAKEAKRLERQAQQSEETEVDNKYTLYLIGGLVAVGAVSYIYLNKGDKKKLPTILEEEPSQPKKSKRIFDE